MKKAILIFLLVSTYSINTCCSQTTNTTQVLEDLKKAKQEAINKEDYAKAAELKAQIDAIDGNQSKIDALQIELNKKLKEEDYAGAAKIKEEIQKLKNKLTISEVAVIEAQSVIAVPNNQTHSLDKIEFIGSKIMCHGLSISEYDVWRKAKKMNDPQLLIKIKKNEKLKLLSKVLLFPGIIFAAGGVILIQAGEGGRNNPSNSSILVPGVISLSVGAIILVVDKIIIRRVKKKNNYLIINRYNEMASIIN